MSKRWSWVVRLATVAVSLPSLAQGHSGPAEKQPLKCLGPPGRTHSTLGLGEKWAQGCCRPRAGTA